MKITRISKEEFVKKLTEIKNDNDYYNALYSVGRTFNREDEINIFPKSLSIAIELLEKAIGDKYECVSWWCFEKKWGERGPEFFVKDEEGNIIPTETMEDIYDLVTLNIKEENTKA